LKRSSPSRNASTGEKGSMTVGSGGVKKARREIFNVAHAGFPESEKGKYNHTMDYHRTGPVRLEQQAEVEEKASFWWVCGSNAGGRGGPRKGGRGISAMRTGNRFPP